MKEDMVRRESYWIVEAVDNRGKIVYNRIFTDFNMACDKFLSFKNKARVTLQRKFKEYKVA